MLMSNGIVKAFGAPHSERVGINRSPNHATTTIASQGGQAVGAIDRWKITSELH